MDIPSRRSGALDRQVDDTGPELDQGARAAREREGDGLAGIDADGARGRRAKDAVDDGRLGETEDRHAAGTVVRVEVIEADRTEAELVITGDGDLAAVDGQGGEGVGFRQGQETEADLLEIGRTRPRGGALRDVESVGDVEIGIRDEVERLAQGHVLLPDAQRATGEVDKRVRAEVGVLRDEDITGGNHGDPRVGVRAGQTERTRAGLVQAVIGAVAVGDDTAEGDDRAVVLSVGRGVDVDRAEGAADGVVGEADIAREGQVGRLAVEGAGEGGIARELGGVGDLAAGREGLVTIVGIAVERAAVEDQRAGPEGIVVADLDGLTEVEGREAAVIIGGIEDDGAAAALERGGVRLDGRADRPDDDVVRAGEDVGAVEVERGAAAAEAVDGAGRKRRETGGGEGRDRGGNDRADEVGRGAVDDAGAVIDRPQGAEEGATVAEGVLVDGQVIADHAEADDAGEGAGGVGIVRGEGRHGADITERQGRQTGEVVGQGEAAADIGRAELDAGARIDGDGAGTERRGGRGRDQADQVTLMDRDRARHGAGTREERERTRTELLQGGRAADGADQEGGVDAGGRRLRPEPCSLIERGRSREDETLLDREHRRINRATLASGEGQ